MKKRTIFLFATLTGCFAFSGCLSYEEPADTPPEEVGAVQSTIDLEDDCGDNNHDDSTNVSHVCSLPGTCLPGDLIYGDAFAHDGQANFNVGAKGSIQVHCLGSGNPGLSAYCRATVTCPDPCSPGNTTSSPPCNGKYVSCTENNSPGPSPYGKLKCTCSNYPFSMGAQKTYSTCPTACA